MIFTKKFAVAMTFLLNGCTIFAAYRDSKEQSFYKSLGTAEKAAIDEQGMIIKKWHGVNKYGDFSKGDIMIIKGSSGKYNFVETGTWTLGYWAFNFSGLKAQVKDSVIYDLFGNIIYREEFFKDLKTNSKYHLFEKWTSTQTDGFKQTIISYYPDGRIRYTQNISVTNSEERITDYSKTKIATATQGYDMTGKPLPEDELQKLVPKWNMMPVSMKKQ